MLTFQTIFWGFRRWVERIDRQGLKHSLWILFALVVWSLLSSDTGRAMATALVF